MDLSDLQAFRSWLAPLVQARPGMQGLAVKAGPMPDTPDRCISVMDYDPGSTVPNWQGAYRAQIRCRAAVDAEGLSSYNDAHATADAVVAVVAPPGDTLAIATLAGGRRATVTKLGDPHPMGPDDKGRWEFTVNVALAAARV
jgi:hypothetical protein